MRKGKDHEFDFYDSSEIERFRQIISKMFGVMRIARGVKIEQLQIGDIGICPRCKPVADREGVMQLNLYWLKKVCEFIIENNKLPSDF